MAGSRARGAWFSYRLLQESIRNKISATRVDSLPVICYIRACRWPRSLKSLNYPRRISTNPGIIRLKHDRARSKYRETIYPLSEICFGPIYGLIPIIARFNFLVSFSLNFARNIIYRRHKSGLRMTSID